MRKFNTRRACREERDALLQIRLDSPSLHVHHACVAEDVPFSDRLSAELVELRVEVRQASNKLIARRLAFQLRGDQRPRAHGLVPSREGSTQGGDEAGENSELARDVRPIEVVSWVGLLDSSHQGAMSGRGMEGEARSARAGVRKRARGQRTV